MGRLCVSFALTLCFLGTAYAQKVTIERIDVIDPGIYTAEVTQVKRDSDQASGEVFYAKVAKLVEKTTTVEAKIGVGFGFKFNVVGQSPDGRANLRSVTIYPQPGVRNPNTGVMTKREELSRSPKLNNPEVYEGFSFENEWEIVTGTWTFEIWDGERKLVSQSFQVVKPL
jgi:hypothetical protein